MPVGHQPQVTWMFFRDVHVLTLEPACNQSYQKIQLSNAVLVTKLKKQLHTWMQTVRRGDISFFRLSLSCPKIFSTHAVSCCLNSMAGYRASTCGRESLRPTSFEGDLSVCKKHEVLLFQTESKIILFIHNSCRKSSSHKYHLVLKLNYTSMFLHKQKDDIQSKYKCVFN